MERLRELGALALIGLVIAGLGAAVPLTDSAWIARHSDRLDRPWADRPDALKNAKELPFNAAFSDKVNLIWPDAVFLHEARQRGEAFPLWNDRILGGVPHAANPLAQPLYPLQLTGWVGNPFHALVLQAMLHLGLGALFFLMWLRSLRIGIFPAAIGAFAFVFSGWVTAHLHNTPIVSVVVWIPLGLFAVERVLTAQRSWALLWLALSIGMQWLAGFPQLAVLGSVAIALYALFGWLKTLRTQARPLVTGFGLAIAAILGLLLSGPQLTTILEASEFCGHQGKDLEARNQESFPPGAWVGLAFPRALGGAGNEFRPAKKPWKDHALARTVLAEDAATEVPDIANWSERTVYPGLVILIMALVGLFSMHRPGFLRSMALAAFGVALAGSETVIELSSKFTGFKEGAPARGVMLLCLVMPLFAARGLEALRQRGPSVAWMVLAALLGILGLGAAYLAYDQEAALSALIEIYRQCGILEAFGAAAWPAAEVRGFLGGDLVELRYDLIAGAVLGCGVAIALVLGRTRARRFMLPAIALLVAIDLLAFFVPPNRPVPREGLYRSTPTIAWLKDNLGEDRFMRVSPNAAQAEGSVSSFMVPNLGVVHGLNDAQGWREQVPQHAIDLWRGIAAAVREVGVSGIPANAFLSPVLDLTRVRYLVATKPIPILAPARVDIPGDESLIVYRNDNALPVAWFVPEARVEEDDAAARKALASGSVDPRKLALLAKGSAPHPSPAVAGGSAEGQVSAKRVDGGWELEVDATGPGWVIVSDTWYPGWEATLREESATESRSVPIERAHVALRAVPVPAGRSMVSMVYEPRSIRSGLWLAAGALLATLALCVVCTRLRGSAPDRATADAVSNPVSDSESEPVA